MSRQSLVVVRSIWAVALLELVLIGVFEVVPVILGVFVLVANVDRHLVRHGHLGLGFLVVRVRDRARVRVRVRDP